MKLDRTDRKMDSGYDEQARAGDHICYYSDLRKIEADYPGWRPEVTLGETLDQIVDAWQRREGNL